jgi:hypothetical protein
MIYENPEDTTTGSDKHFKKIDIDSLRYDFRLDSLSQAIDAASTETSYPTDRDGSQRDEKPDMGAFEYIKPTN